VCLEGTEMSGTSVTEWHQAWRSLEVSEDALEEFLVAGFTEKMPLSF